MANTLLTVDMIAKEAIRVAHEKASFIGTINMQYDDQFGNVAGSVAKTGAALRVKLPNQYTRRNGSRIMNVQDQDEASISIVLATQDGVDMRFNSAELALDIDAFSAQHIVPAVNVLISGIESDCLIQATQDTPNFSGTAGTVVGVSGDITALTNARGKLNRNLAPKDMNRYVQLDSITMGSVVNGLQALFHDGTQIKEAFREGFYRRNAMADFYENERTYLHTNGADHTTVTVNDTVAEGDSVITTAGGTVTAGTPFTIANVNQVHPETKVSYGTAMEFVITAVNGNDWTVYPAFRAAGAKQNIDALPANGAAITLLGAASTAYRRNLMYHKDAFSFVTADLPIMADAALCVRRNYEGLAMRVWQGSDIRNDEFLMRIDILWGFKSIRPEWACQITN